MSNTGDVPLAGVVRTNIAPARSGACTRKRPLVRVAAHQALALRHADDAGRARRPPQEDDGALAGENWVMPCTVCVDVADGAARLDDR